MPEEILEAAQPTQVTEPISAKGRSSFGRNWPKIILAAVLGFGLLAASAYAGYWYGTQQVQPTDTFIIAPTPEPSKPRTGGNGQPPSDIPEELKCEEDSNCGVNICDCKALNKNYIEPEDKICMRVCNKVPICYQGRCIFKGEENRYEIGRE
jgi:hypothetical protein